MQIQWLMPKDASTFRYRVRHWSRYLRALIARGELTFAQCGANATPSAKREAEEVGELP